MLWMNCRLVRMSMSRVGMRSQPNLQENDQVLVYSDRHFLVSSVDLFPILVAAGAVCCGLGSRQVELVDFINKALHALLASTRDAGLQFLSANFECCVGSVEQRLHDRRMFARVDANHLDIAGKEGKVFQRRRFVLVVPDDVVHHQVRRQRLSVGKIARQIETRNPVPRRVHDIERIGSLTAARKSRVSQQQTGMVEAFAGLCELTHFCHRPLRPG